MQGNSCGTISEKLKYCRQRVALKVGTGNAKVGALAENLHTKFLSLTPMQPGNHS